MLKRCGVSFAWVLLPSDAHAVLASVKKWQGTNRAEASVHPLQRSP